MKFFLEEDINCIFDSLKNKSNKLSGKNILISGGAGFLGTYFVQVINKLNERKFKKPCKVHIIDRFIDKEKKKFLNKNKNLINKLLKKIEEIICLHVDKQIEAGANVIQIFDSWAGLLPKKELLNYCYIPTLKIIEHIKPKNIPVICFPKGIGENYVDFCSIVKPNCISIDYEIDPKWIKEKVNGIPIQGGLDPKILLTDKEKIKKSTENYLNIFKDYPYIFNLGHGVLPETKPETIEYLIKIVRKK